MMAGLNAAIARHTMFTGVILWRMAPWPYTLKVCDAQQGRSIQATWRCQRHLKSLELMGARSRWSEPTEPTDAPLRRKVEQTR
jgi:hypothetical protein